LNALFIGRRGIWPVRGSEATSACVIERSVADDLPR